ncbi:hypothetical protein LTR08_000765 [Meristemomyces frigidus]|nr:hypothetical protein LTR08_000765 [Meristemomyces frigidus]
MATMQIQKTRNAETVTKTAIDQRQSLELVQTMLHGGLSSLSYLRAFFAEKAFDKQVYEMNDRIHPYEDYAAGKLTKNINGANSPSTAMRILRRGRSKRVDTFLDWLENGAFAALKAGHLQALQVYVHADSADRQKVVETYTFTIKYTKDGGNGKAVAGLEMDGPGSPLVSIQATNSALQTLLRRIMDVCQGLPDLPEKRFISMELFYIPDIKQLSTPKGWMSGTSDKLLFAHANGWQKHTETLKELDSVFHRSTLKVTALIQPAHRSTARFVQTSLPDDLQYSTATSKQADIDNLDADPRVVELPDESPGRGSVTETTTPSTIIEEATKPVAPQLEVRRKTMEKPSPTPALTSDPPETTAIQQTRPESPTPDVHNSVEAAFSFPSQLDDSLNTQSSNVQDMRYLLQGMMLPERISQGDTQTQNPVQRPPPPTETTTSPNRSTISPSKTAEPTVSDKAVLSPTKIIELQRNMQKLHHHARELAKQASRKPKKGEDIVLCQCGHSEEEGEMIECTFCKTWQHLHCYGYTGTSDPRVPEDHICYQCLLGGEEQGLLDKVRALALKRRGMHLALRKGLTTQREFADELDLEGATANPVYQYLKTQGYVVAATGTHKAGYKQSGKPLFVAVKEGVGHERMLQALFDPLLHISHHYQLPTKAAMQHSSLTQRLLAAQAKDMPPPATPASALRKRNAITPGSGLDQLPSMTPYQTPSRPRQPQKRSFDDDEDTPGSIFKRFKSVQTQYMLDANGLPSSPADSFSHY